MGQKIKALKGEISISNFQGRIRLRWRYAGERYSLNLPHAYLPENLHHGTVKVTEIKLDIIKGCFDPSLDKYKPEIIVKPVASKQVEIQATKLRKCNLLLFYMIWFQSSMTGVITSEMLTLKIHLITCTPGDCLKNG